ncbi:MAG: cation diffusion facilitator family transporter [Syntrophales bacterium]|jgi:cation diffusion facilitator family transporter
MNSQQRKERIALLSVISNSVLVIIKLIIGLIIGSVSILSEAIHSVVDLVAASIALFSVKTSSTPADRQHPYGHGKIENISGTIEALLIFIAAGWIIYEAVKKIIHPEPLAGLGWGLGVMLISTIVNILVSGMLFKIDRETDSIALRADAWHHRTDVYTSAGVMGSLAVMWIAHNMYSPLNLNWLDPAAAIGVAILIIRAAYDLTRQSAKDLLDETLPVEEEEWIRQQILQHVPKVHGFHHLKTRKSGHFRFVEFHLKVNPMMTVWDSHRITEELSEIIKSQYPDASVTIHVEPCDGNCMGNCLKGCLLPEKERLNIKKKVLRPL